MAGYVMVLDTKRDPRWAGRRFGFQEPEVWRVIQSNVNPGDVAYDIGAHIGTFVLYLAKRVGPQGKVVAYEPDASNFKILEQNVIRNRLSHVAVYARAVGSSHGKGEITSEAFSSMSKVVPGAGGVEISTLDREVFDVGGPHPSFVLVDAEGSELDVITGAGRVLDEVRPVLLIEHHSDRTKVIEAIEGHGYSSDDVDINHTLHRPT